MMKINGRISLWILMAMVAALVAPSLSLGADDFDLDALLLGEATVEPYVFPEIAPYFKLEGGYIFTDHDGGFDARHYGEQENSALIGGEARMFFYPHRLYLLVDSAGTDNYFNDFRYAYRDYVFFRGLTRSVYHHLAGATLTDFDASTSNPSVDIRDAGEDYGIKTSMENYFLRFKVPDRAMHVYTDYFIFRQSGQRQSISLLGSGWYDNLRLASQAREVDQKSVQCRVGANTHLGPLEVEYEHRADDFSSTAPASLYDQYDTLAYRTAGLYEHGTVPELEGNSDTIRVHTSYTGRLVASGTFTARTSDNNYSGASSDYIAGASSIAWLPTDKLGFFLRYSHVDMDAENPSQVTVTNLADASTYTYDVLDALSTTTDKVSLTGRYRMPGVMTLRAAVDVKQVDRENAELWGLEPSTTEEKISASFNTVRFWKLRLRGEASGTSVTDPAYNTEPDDVKEGSVALVYAPTGRFVATVGYGVEKGERDGIEYALDSAADSRQTSSSRAYANMTFMTGKDFAVTFGYALFDNSIKQDVGYYDENGNILAAPGTVYDDRTQCYSVDFNTRIMERFMLTAGVAYTRGGGSYDTNNIDMDGEISVADLTDFKYAESELRAALEYEAGGGYTVGLEYQYSELDDVDDNMYDDIEDGTEHLLVAKLSKRWD